MTGGWWGKNLVIDLGRGTAATEPLDPEDLERWLGGRGLGAELLCRAVPIDVDPLGPENRILIAAGPLTGTAAPTSGRSSLCTVSPLTGALHDSSAGGTLGVCLKRAGYDLITITGAASDPVALVIEQSEVRFISATEMWGKTTDEVSSWLKSAAGQRAATACIGPAGVNRCLVAGVIVDGRRAYARGGTGAVFGSKNLLGLAVSGSRQVPVADQDRFHFARYEAEKLLSANPITSRGLPAFGTAVLVNLMNEAGVLPTRNFRESSFAEAPAVSGEALSGLLAKKSACWGCRIACGRVIRWQGKLCEGPEYESIWALGPNCGIGRLEPIIAANLRCNELGLDTISAGSSISCAMERGGLGVSFGDHDGMLRTLTEMAYRDGPGSELSDGARAFAERSGLADIAMHVRGLELPAYDPRGMQGQGLALATSNRGGCHLRANMLGPEIVGSPKMVDRFAHRGRAGLVIVFQHSHAVVDSLGVCKFAGFALGDEHWARLLSAVTGTAYATQDLQAVGERIWHRERLRNLARGGRVAHDALPRRLVETPVTSGPAAGSVVRLDEMLSEYYRFRGWDESGRPLKHTLARLGLELEGGGPGA